MPLTIVGEGSKHVASGLLILFDGMLILKLSSMFEVKDESDLNKNNMVLVYFM
jgi:hypothetical protein